MPDPRPADSSTPTDRPTADLDDDEDARLDWLGSRAAEHDRFLDYVHDLEADVWRMHNERADLIAIAEWVADREDGPGGCKWCEHRHDEAHRPDGLCPRERALKVLGR